MAGDGYTVSKDLGPVSAYAIAVAEGYQGTRAQWEAEIANASLNAQTAHQESLESEGYAKGSQDGTAVTADSPYYQANAKYYSEQAATAKTAAETAITHAPYIGTNDHWFVWNAVTGEYVDTGTLAGGNEEEILIQATQPTEVRNKLWFNNSAVTETVELLTEADVSAKADKTDTVLETTLSRGRKDNTTIGTGSFAFGNYAEASGVFSHAEGVNTVASGARAHSEGSTTKATEDSAHAEGRSTTASGTGSHAEGSSSKATDSSAHAEGDNTTASATASHAEGINTVASGSYSHAEGGNTTASGFDSHAEGTHSVASGYFSHAEGDHTIANTKSMHACGAYNEANVIYPDWVSGTTYSVGNRVKQGNSGYECKTENSDATFTSSNWTLLPSTGDMLFVIGNGMYESSRSNAMEVDWDGNAKFAGSVYANGQRLPNHFYYDQTTITGRSGGTTTSISFTCTVSEFPSFVEGDFIYVKFCERDSETSYQYRTGTLYGIGFSDGNTGVNYGINNFDTYTSGLTLFKPNHIYQFRYNGLNFDIINYDPE